MLNMPTIGEVHLMQRERLAERHAELLAETLEENSHKDKYWILGWTKTKRKEGKTRITPFMKALDIQPEVTKESYLYEVDNIAGTRNLLWVMHPNNKLSMPSIGKSINVAS
jgi:hypothetical protein